MMRGESSFLDEISFKARVFELSHFPVSVKSPLGAVRRVPKVVPYEPNARDGDNDGLVQEGTIWERPNGAVFRGLARGARKLAGSVDLVDGSGNRIDYKPGDHENSPLRGGRVERRIRGRGQRRLNRAERRRERAERERDRAPEQREELDALDQQIARLENAVAEDSRQRLLQAEADTEEWNDEMNSFLDGLIEGWSGIRKGKNTPKGNEVARAVEKLEGERRQTGDANGRTPKRDHEDLFDDEILAEDVDRDEHRRKLDEDPDYRREWNRRLLDGERNEDGTVAPPRDGEIPSIPEVDADEVRSVQELIEAVREQDAGSLPDDRSRRNVRNRFPQRGLPEEAFWRNDDYEPRDGRDRDAEISEHDRRFGRYYDDDGNLNDRGRLVNEQLREEREEADAPETPESQGGGAPDPDADIPEDDGPRSPRQRLVEIYQEDMGKIEDFLSGEPDGDAEQIDRDIDFIDSFVEEVDSSLDAGAISVEERDGWVRRATDVRDRLDAERVDIRREIDDRDNQIDADMDSEEDRGRIVEDGDVQVPGEDIDVPEVGRPEEGWALYADLSDEQLEERLDDGDPPDLDFLLREERRRGDLMMNDNELAELRNDLQARGWVNRDREIAEEQERRVLLNEVLPDLPEEADAPDPDLPDLGMADSDPPWPVRRYADMEDREVEQRIDRIIAADPEGFRGFRLDERDALIEERRRRRDAGVWDGDPIVVDGFAPAPDSDSPEADLAVQQQENLINEWNDFLDDPNQRLSLFRSVDELGQIARGEFPVGDIDPTIREHRAAFQQLARRQINQRAVADMDGRELPSGETVFDVADMDDGQLNTRIAGLVAADPIGDNVVISAQLRALQQERARRQGFNPEEQRLIDALDDEELEEVIDGGALSEALGEAAQVSAAIEKRNRSKRNRTQTDPEEVESFRVVDEDVPRYELVEDFFDSEEFTDFEAVVNRDHRSPDDVERMKDLKRAVERGDYTTAIHKIDRWERDLLPALPGDPDPKVPYKRFRRVLESHQARKERNVAIRKIVGDDHVRVREMNDKNSEVGLILNQALDGRVSDAELAQVIDALSDFDTPRVPDARNRNDGRAKEHNMLNSKRNQLIMLRDMRGNRVDANPDERVLLDADWDEEFLTANDQRIKDVIDNINIKIKNLREKKTNWVKELEARRSDNVRVPDENVEPFLPEDMDLMDNLLNLRVEFNNKFKQVDSGAFKSVARQALKDNRQSLYEGRRGAQHRGDLHHGAKWRNEIGDRGETLEKINGVHQRDLSDLDNEGLSRVILEEMIPSLKKKIGRDSAGRRRMGNDEAQLGVAGVDGHIANVDRALAELNRRWDEASANDEVRQSIKQARTKLRNIRTGAGNTRVNLEKERQIRVTGEERRIVDARDADGQARDAVQARKDHMEQFSNILAVNGIGDMDINDRGFDENAVEIREALNAILEDPENPDAPRLYVELNNWRQRARDIGQTHGIDANEFFGGDDNGWRPLTELPEDALKNNQNFSEKAQIVKQLISDHKIRMNEKVFDDVHDRRLVDLANMEDMLQNFDDNGMDSLLQEVVNDFEAVDAPGPVDRAEFNSRYATFKTRLDSIKALHKERKDRKEVDNFNAKAEDLLIQIPRNDDGLSAEERKAILAEAIVEAMNIENGGNQFSGDVRQYRELLQNERESVDREVWAERRASNGIEELPEQVMRGDINDPAIGNVPRSGLVEHDSNGKPILRQVPVGNKGMNTQKDADTYLGNGGHMKDVPTDFLSDAIFANSAEKHSVGSETKRFHYTRSRISGGINADAQDPAMTNFEDQATGAIFGIKYHGGGYAGNGVYFGENEDIGEILGADLISHFGLLQGRVTRGGKPISTDRNRAAPVVFEFAQEITPDGEFDLASNDFGGYRDVVSGDLVKGLIADALIHNTDRHAKNYGYYRDRNGNKRLYLIDNSLIDGARNGVRVFDHRVNNVKKYLRGMAGLQGDSTHWKGELKGRHDAGDTAIREAVNDFMSRLETFDANDLESLLLNLMPEVEADRVDLNWLKERVEELRALGADQIMELITE